MKNKFKITERGWPGHFICASQCIYRRNTLLECGRKRIVVSTVGNYRPVHKNGDAERIGCDRFYETMAFKACKKGVYWEADVSKQVDFESQWSLNEVEEETDLKADAMHEKVVKELSDRISK